MSDCFRVTNGAIQLAVKAVPGASKTEIAGIADNCLRVRIAAAPEDGKANAELCVFLAKLLGCPKRDIRLVKGEKSRLKTVAFPAGYLAKFEAILNEVMVNVASRQLYANVSQLNSLVL